MRRLFHCVLLTVVVFFATVACVCESAETTSEATADFRWFSRLGFPDVAGCAYVTITGGWNRLQSGLSRDDSTDGFLLQSNGQVLHFLTLNLTEVALTNSVRETNEDQQISYIKLDLKTEARAALQIAESSPKKYVAVPSVGKPLTDQTRLFVLAWACWRQGLDEEATQLYAEAKTLPNWWGGGIDTAKSFHESLERNLASVVMGDALDSFYDPTMSRPQLQRMFQSIATNYPDSMWRDPAAQAVDILQRMITEDEAHVKNPVTNLEQLPIDARVSELIFRLRDQNGRQWGNPGTCDIFCDLAPGSDTNTAAHQLVRLGYAAVPRLIAALEDKTFTRSVGNWPDGWCSVMTVGNCAEAILKRITGRSFYVWTPLVGHYRNGPTSETREAAEAWWAECQNKGERQMLVDEILSLGEEAPDEAEILCRQYPDAAVPTLVKAIGTTTNEEIRSDLVRLLGGVEGTNVATFLSQEMTNSPVLKSRVNAASGLRRFNNDAAVAAMIRQWLNFDPSARDLENGGSDLIRFLAGCDSPEAIRALAQNIETRSLDTRLEVVDDIDFGWSSCCGTNSLATEIASEELLVKELADTEQRVGMEISRGGKELHDPRACDVAGDVLAKQCGDRYTFDMGASFRVRDRQRIQCINVWRKAHKLPVLLLPAEPAIHLPADKATTITEIEWDERSVKPSVEFAKAVEMFRGAPLETTRVVKLLADYALAPEKPSAGFHFEALKDGDLTGVRLRISLLPGKQLTSQQDYSLSQHVYLGGKMLLASGGGGGSDDLGSADGWVEFAQAVNQALAGDSRTPFEVGVQIKGDSSDVTTERALRN